MTAIALHKAACRLRPYARRSMRRRVAALALAACAAGLAHAQLIPFTSTRVPTDLNIGASEIRGNTEICGLNNGGHLSHIPVPSIRCTSQPVSTKEVE